MTKNLTVNRQHDLFLTVNRQRDPLPPTPPPPIETLKQKVAIVIRILHVTYPVEGGGNL